MAVRVKKINQAQTITTSKADKPSEVVSRKISSILIVDDYLPNLTLSRLQLERGGHRISTVDTGIKAVACCEKQRFDLILMDINMAGMDGYQTTQMIKTNEWTRDVPIIAMTASADDHTRQKCRRFGMADLITKPIGKSQILKMADKWLRQPARRHCSSQACYSETSIDSSNRDEAVMNPQRALDEFIGDGELLAAVFRQFVTDMDDRLEYVFEAMENNAFDTVRAQAHAIKGAAANLTAMSLARAAGNLEKHGAEKNRSQCRQAFECLKKECRRLQSYFHKGRWRIEHSDC